MDTANLSFYGLGIAPKIIETLTKLRFKTPTPIQHKAIPLAIEGKDIIGIAQTGTGKTMAFGIPIVQYLAQNNKRGLILVPTRELALQVEESVRKIAQAFNIRTVVLIGGDPIEKQLHILAKNPRIIIATPGRLIDLMQQKKIRLSDVAVLVLDEADRMLDMGFAPQIETIIRTVPRDRQTMLFSATMPAEIVRLASSYMKIPLQVEIARPGTSAETVTHELFIVNREMKRQLLTKLLAHYRGSVLLFCRTKIGASKITRMLRDDGHSAAEIHSDRSLSQRRQALDGFKSGKHRVLVATDIAARGIDVQSIEIVINFDLPEDAENYIHRIGRTGRAGLTGHAISFATPDQKDDVQNIERLMKKVLPISKHPDLPAVDFDKPRSFTAVRMSSGRRGGHRYGRR